MLNISSVDATIVLFYVLATLAFGLVIGRGAQSLSSYLIGQRSLPWYAVLGSIIATETSAVTFLSIPGTSFASQGDFTFLQLALGFVIGRWIAIAWLLPLFFQRKIFTAYDVLRQRFGALTQRTSSLIFLLTRTLADGLRLYLTGLVLEKMTGLHLTTCITILGVITIIYCSAGGIKSVVWNDCIQLIVYLIGALVTVWVIGQNLPNGIRDIVDVGLTEKKFHLLQWQFSFYQPNLWAGIIGGSFISLATHGVDQMMVQRYLCARSQRSAAVALGLSGPLVFAQFALFLFVGVALAAFYQLDGHVAPLEKDGVLATFIVREMPVGFCGLILSAVFSVAMSTLSSSLSSSASAVINDFIKPRLLRLQPDAALNLGSSSNSSDAEGSELSPEMDRRLTRSSRIWTIVFGCLQILVGVVVASTPVLSTPSAINQVITIAGLTSGLILGVFALGLSTRAYRETSLLFGMLMGFGTSVLPILAPAGSLLKIHGWWTAVIACTVTFCTAWIFDRLFHRHDL